MRQLHPVMWNKGTFLQPQHLQYQDLYLESQLSFLVEALIGYPYGFHSLTIDDAALAKVKQDLLALAASTHPKVTITQYTDLPEGKLSIAQAWSGDAINMPSYLPSGKSASILRYWFPADGRGVVNSDLMVVMRGGKNPVLAHLFLDHMLDPEVAAGNFSATGYQPPQLSIDPKKIVADGTVPANLASAVVRPEAFDTGYRTLELPPEVDARWQAIWTQFKAGA